MHRRGRPPSVAVNGSQAQQVSAGLHTVEVQLYGVEAQQRGADRGGVAVAGVCVYEVFCPHQLLGLHHQGGHECEAEHVKPVSHHFVTPNLMVTFSLLPIATDAGTVMSSTTGPEGRPEIT